MATAATAAAGSDTTRDLDTVFKALDSAARRDALRMISESSTDDPVCCGPQEVCACKISERLGLSASTVSHHMAILQEAGLVSARKDGLWVYYSVRKDALGEAADWLARL
jgi:ArsR family transcriptional regulator